MSPLSRVLFFYPLKWHNVIPIFSKHLTNNKHSAKHGCNCAKIFFRCRYENINNFVLICMQKSL